MCLSIRSNFCDIKGLPERTLKTIYRWFYNILGLWQWEIGSQSWRKNYKYKFCPLHGGTQMMFLSIRNNFGVWAWTWPWFWPVKVIESNWIAITWGTSYTHSYVIYIILGEWPWEIGSRSWPKNEHFGHWRHPGEFLLALEATLSLTLWPWPF